MARNISIFYAAYAVKQTSASSSFHKILSSCHVQGKAGGRRLHQSGAASVILWPVRRGPRSLAT